MLIPEDSPLGRPPSAFSRRQVLIPDGIRYAQDGAHSLQPAVCAPARHRSVYARRLVNRFSYWARPAQCVWSPERNLMVPYFAYGSAVKLSRPDLSAVLLEAQHFVRRGGRDGTSA